MVRLGTVSRFLLAVAVGISLLPGLSGGTAKAQAQPSTRFFPETGQTVQGRFLEYWQDNGGLMQQGYPISGELQERSPVDGRIYTVQYFERAVFELHPENAKPNDVLLSLLGVMEYNRKYPGGAPGQKPNTDPGSIFFPETGKRVGGSFLIYFTKFGDVRQQGYPISDEFYERSDLDGRVRVVQYFQRAVFEWNPSNTPPYNVLLAQLGTFAYRARQVGGGQPAPLLEPALPEPLVQNTSQFYPRASDRFLVWHEGNLSGPSYRGRAYDFNIRALDLTSNLAFAVTSQPGNEVVLAMDGPLVVWRTGDNVCEPCFTGLYATDLVTRKQYTLAQPRQGEPWTPSFMAAAVAGRSVAWFEYGSDGGFRVVAKDVDTLVTKVLSSTASAPPQARPSPVALSGGGNYIVWSEVTYHTGSQGSSSGYAFSVNAYDLAADVATPLVWMVESPATGNGLLPSFALDGGRFVWRDSPSTLQVVNLLSNDNTRNRTVEYAGDVEGLALYGNRLLIYGSTRTGVTLLDLSQEQPQPVALLQPPSGAPPQGNEIFTATVAGDWLVWSNSAGPQPRLAKMKLLVGQQP